MREKVLMVAVLFTVSILSALILAAANTITEPRIAMEHAGKLKRSVLASLGVPFDPLIMEKVFSAEIMPMSTPYGPVYFSRDGAASFEIKGPGFWGPISAVVALEPDAATIRGIVILDQKETPGLGARITEDWFTARFAGKRVDTPLAVFLKGKPASGNDVEAITGATLTSRALVKLINTEAAPYRDVIRRLRHGGK